MSSEKDYTRVDLDIGKDKHSSRDVVIDRLRHWKESGRPFTVLVLRMCRATTKESANELEEKGLAWIRDNGYLRTKGDTYN